MIEEFDQQVQLNHTFTLNSLLGDLDMTRFYTYKGSLTTPPCSEAVTWILFPEVLDISVSQIRRFRMVTSICLSNSPVQLVTNILRFLLLFPSLPARHRSARIADGGQLPGAAAVG